MTVKTGRNGNKMPTISGVEIRPVIGKGILTKGDEGVTKGPSIKRQEMVVAKVSQKGV